MRLRKKGAVAAALNGFIDHMERVWLIGCSRCNNTCTSYVENVEEAAQGMLAMGWRFNHPRVMCPTCTQELSGSARLIRGGGES